jgi:hypothetical protein
VNRIVPPAVAKPELLGSTVTEGRTTWSITLRVTPPGCCVVTAVAEFVICVIPAASVGLTVTT